VCASAGAKIGDVQNVMGVLYSATNFQGMFNLMNVRPLSADATQFLNCLPGALKLRFNY
jgi:hypothetical protein